MLASASFRIPVARDAKGRLVPPEEAVKGRRYACPSCAAAVHLHAGEKKKRHYHHGESACSRETVLHVSAKRLIVQAVEAWRAGDGPAPVFVRACARAPRCEERTRQPIPKKVSRALCELRLASGHVVDVGLVGVADLPIAAVEVLVSHAVDARKAFEIGVPWIEVDAGAVCDTRGRELSPVRDHFLPWLCADHADRRGEAHRDAQIARKTKNQLVRALPYRIEEFPGYVVSDVTRCPNGHDALVFAWSGREPPWPRPPHVVACAADEDVVYDASQKKLRGVMAFRRRWASACAKCGALLEA
ncbi:MAG: hypothetical protein KF819_26400 [Labilithrix sp.]|nr:hypothetical protein [Labilithrix sp.]